jgi:glycosyltransferase involved in cell wall biosynthesis
MRAAEKKKTLVVVQWGDYRGSPLGGIPVFVEAVLPHLRDHFEVKLVGLTLDESLGHWKRISLNGREYDFLPIVKWPPTRVPDRVRLALAVLKYRKQILAAGAAAYYVHMTEAAIPLVMLGRAPVIIHVHGLYNLFRFSRSRIGRLPVFAWMYDRFYPSLFSRCAMVFGVGSRAEFESFRKRMCVKAGEWTPTCVRDRIFKPLNREQTRADLGIPPDRKLVMYAGRMTDTKNPRMLLEAVQLLRQEFPGLTVALAGSGVQEQELRTDFSHDSGVIFLGAIGSADLVHWMNAADVFALSSKIEGVPTAALEALACGLPVAATPVGVIPEIIHDGLNGAIADEITANSFATTLQKILRNPPSRTACISSATPYSPKAVGSRIAEGIDALLD